jgi:hypothetical protein
VATDVAGHSEIVVEGVTGFLADAPTVRSVGKALERLWARRMDLESIGKEAAKNIHAKVPKDPLQEFTKDIKAAAGIA